MNAKAVVYDNRFYGKMSDSGSYILFKSQEQAISNDSKLIITYEVATKTITLDADNYDRVASIGSRTGAITTDASFEVTSGKVAKLTGQLPYLTTAPSDPNTAGFVKIVVLDSEPSEYKNGFLYFVTESAE